MTSLSNSAVEAYILMNVKSVVKSYRFIIKFESTRGKLRTFTRRQHAQFTWTTDTHQC